MSHNIDTEKKAINIASSYIEKALNKKSQLFHEMLDFGSQYIEDKIIKSQQVKTNLEQHNSFVEKVIRNSSDQERTR